MLGHSVVSSILYRMLRFRSRSILQNHQNHIGKAIQVWKYQEISALIHYFYQLEGTAFET